MPYLTQRDYATYIQGPMLTQLVQADQSKRVTEEAASIQMIAGYLKAKYDLNTEFTETLPYSRTKVYGAGSRVTVDVDPFGTGFSTWTASIHYDTGDLVIYSGIGYLCNSANSDSTFTPSNWDYIAPQFTIYYAAFPGTCTFQGNPCASTLMEPYAPVFNYLKLYSVNDIVFWRGYTYEAAQSSIAAAHLTQIQYVNQSQIPFPNIFPDDPIGNKDGVYWKEKTLYAVAGDTPLTDPAWVQGDNRNQVLKDAIVVFTVFKLSPLIAPQNRPEVWKQDFIGHRSDLKMYALGELNLSLPLNQPSSGRRTLGGGEVKRVNNW